jgi:hypothetical protein
MSNVMAIKLEKNEKVQIVAQPAQVINFVEKRNEIIQTQIVALEGIQALKILVADYEIEMEKLAETVSAEDLAQVTSLTAEEQINEDLRRLNTLVEALEYIVTEKKGFSLAQALEILKSFGGEEMTDVINYLEKSNYPSFVALMNVVKA